MILRLLFCIAGFIGGLVAYIFKCCDGVRTYQAVSGGSIETKRLCYEVDPNRWTKSG